jgi:hypothetical protein
MGNTGMRAAPVMARANLANLPKKLRRDSVPREMVCVPRLTISSILVELPNVLISSSLANSEVISLSFITFFPKAKNLLQDKDC